MYKNINLRYHQSAKVLRTRAHLQDELAFELRALQDICQRERDITKVCRSFYASMPTCLAAFRVNVCQDLRKLHQMDLEEISLQMQASCDDASV